MKAFDLQHPRIQSTSALQSPFRDSFLAIIVVSSLAHNVAQAAQSGAIAASDGNRQPILPEENMGWQKCSGIRRSCLAF